MIDNRVNEIYNCLRVMDMLLYKNAYEPKTVIGFESTIDMAKFFREMLHVILPDEYQYHKE